MLHQFWLLDTSEWSFSTEDNFAYLRNHPTRITIHDDFIWYINDTLQWVETSNPANKKEWSGYGLNMYGPTIIATTGAKQFEIILSAWVNLLRNGPDNIELTGYLVYDIDEDGNKTNGRYNKIKMKRDEMLDTLRKLGEYASKSQQGSSYILHFGL